jgi:hypothetical protein
MQNTSDIRPIIGPIDDVLSFFVLFSFIRYRYFIYAASVKMKDLIALALSSVASTYDGRDLIVSQSTLYP